MLKTFLKQFNYFDTLDANGLARLEKEAYISKVPQNTSFMETGNICSSVYFIIEGRMRVYKILPDGKEITLYRIGPGEMCLFSMKCLLNQSPLDIFADVESPSQLLVVPEETFVALMAQNPTFQRNIMGRLLGALSDVLLLLEEVTFHSMNKRLANHLLLQVHPSQMTLKQTHESIASELGTAREVVSRLLKEFEKQEILELSRGKIKILCAEKLIEIANA